MPLFRRTAGGASGLRDFAARVRRRTDRFPRIPFGIALCLACVCLAVVIDVVPDPDAKIADVEELSLPDQEVPMDPGEYDGAESVDLTILEYGFGLIEVEGGQRISVGAVVHNPHPTLGADVLFAVTATDESGEQVQAERFRLNGFAPDRDSVAAYVLAEEATQWAGAELRLTVDEAYVGIPPAPSDAEVPLFPQTRTTGFTERSFDLLETVPLVAPEGHRVVYRADSAAERALTVGVNVVFRDAGGDIVGGMGGDDELVEASFWRPAVQIPPGTSVHHFDLPAGQVPEGADLDRIEIGPGGVIGG